MKKVTENKQTPDFNFFLINLVISYTTQHTFLSYKFKKLYLNKKCYVLKQIIN